MGRLERFQLFRDLHSRSEPLLIGNAWDVVSALVMEPFVGAIGLSSAATAASLGFKDDQSLPLSSLCEVSARVIRAVALPVSVDVQAGYSLEPDACARNIVDLCRVGAVGINLEDRATAGGLAPADDHARRIEAVRAATEAAGLPIFINARTDAFEFMPFDEAVREAIARAKRYVEAGADGIFVPFVTDMPAIRALASSISAPLNILATSPDLLVSELREAGVRRLSFGSSPMQCALGTVRAFYEEVAGTGRASRLSADRLSYDEIQRLLKS